MASTSAFGWETPDDTDLVKDGAAAIRTLGNSIDTSMSELKGGTTGQVLSKTSATDMDFTWVAQTSIPDSYGFTAGKNKIINGDFAINQRGFTSTTTSNTYGFDRFVFTYSDGTSTHSAQTFTPGSAPVSGYEAANYCRTVTTGQTLASAFTTISQRIENVRTLAGQTVTVSFWAKAGSGTPKIGVELAQNFGTGGSPSAQVNTLAGTVTLSTSWVRYSATVALPSISGKTIGSTTPGQVNATLWISAGSDFNARTGSIGIQSNTFDIWGLQVEAGSSATSFQTATGTIQGELAACQRYYWRNTTGANYGYFTTGYADSTTTSRFYIQFPVTMRTIPTALDYSSGIMIEATPGAGLTPSTITLISGTVGNSGTAVSANFSSGLTQYRPYALLANNTPTAYLGFTAEL